METIVAQLSKMTKFQKLQLNTIYFISLILFGEFVGKTLVMFLI
jgi:hypothetical protein